MGFNSVFKGLKSRANKVIGLSPMFYCRPSTVKGKVFPITGPVWPRGWVEV